MSENYEQGKNDLLNLLLLADHSISLWNSLLLFFFLVLKLKGQPLSIRYHFKHANGEPVLLRSSCYSFQNPYTDEAEYIVCTNNIVKYVIILLVSYQKETFAWRGRNSRNWEGGELNLQAPSIPGQKVWSSIPTSFSPSFFVTWRSRKDITGFLIINRTGCCEVSLYFFYKSYKERIYKTGTLEKLPFARKKWDNFFLSQ